MSKRTRERARAIAESLKLEKDVSKKSKDQKSISWKSDNRRAVTNLGDLLIQAMWGRE